MTSGHMTLEALREGVNDGSVDNVRVCIADHYGMLRGRRVVGEVFAENPAALQGYCDGALVWDVHCDIFESTDYSNFRTGYPDVFARADLDSLIRCGWSPGSTLAMSEVLTPEHERSPLDPRGLLRVIAGSSQTGQVSSSLELRVGGGALEPGWTGAHVDEFAARWREGIEQSGIRLELLDWDDGRGVLRAELAPTSPLASADHLVAVRSAAREIGLVDGHTVTTMPLLAAGQSPARMLVATDDEIGDEVQTRLGDVALLCRPLPLDWLGAEPLIGGNRLAASSQANPYLAIAALLAAVGSNHAAEQQAGPGDYRDAADRFDGAEWVRGQFGEMFVHDTLELARREQGMRLEGTDNPAEVSDWDIERYGEVG